MDGATSAPAELHQAARDGQPGARERLSAFYRSAYPEPGTDPPATRSAPAGVRPPADPHPLHTDPAFRERLRSDDWLTRRDAQAELERAYTAAEPGHAPVRREDAPTFDEHGVPSEPARYTVPAVISAEAPVLGEALRTIGHQLRLPAAEFTGLCRAVERLAAVGERPDAILAAQHAGLLATVDPATLDRARRAWAMLERERPDLADALESVGATVDRELVELLARGHRP